MDKIKFSVCHILIHRKFIASVNSPIVFSHNDLQGGNILAKKLPENKDEHGGTNIDISEIERRLVVIDFEFCSYNFRAFDVANHWTERMYDYGLEESPYYTILRDKYPSKQEQVGCLNRYPDIAY